MKISIASDHAGFELKKFLIEELLNMGHDVYDHGAHELIPEDDYPTYISYVARDISKYEESKINGHDTTHTELGEEKGDRHHVGIVIGGSGQGEAIVANKFPHVRAATVYGGSSAGGSKELIDNIVRLSREHNDSNIISLGARFITKEEALDAVKLWLETDFADDERHIRRIKEIDEIEKNEFKHE